MVLMIDIVTIYLIFSEPHKFDFSKLNKKDKKKKKKNNSIDKIKKTKDKNIINNDKNDNNSIEVYNEEKSVSLNTFQ
jgi:hypothetical protein